MLSWQSKFAIAAPKAAHCELVLFFELMPNAGEYTCRILRQRKGVDQRPKERTQADLLKLNLRFKPGIKEMIFGERCICRPSGVCPKFTYSPLTSRTTMGAPSCTKLVTRSFVRCDLPVPFRPVTMLSRPSNALRSEDRWRIRRIEPSSKECFAARASVRNFGGITST